MAKLIPETQGESMGPQWALRLRMMLNTDMCLAFSEMEGPRGPGGTLDLL